MNHIAKSQIYFLTSFLETLKSRIKEEIKITLIDKNKDISLSTDKFINRELISFLKANTTFPILSEESENQANFLQFNDHFWIVDPLDGTLNYSRSIPISCISIALWKGVKPIIGVIYDFLRDEMFIGVAKKSEFAKEVGAWLNNIPIITSEVKSKSDGVIATGFPSWRDYGTKSIAQFVTKVQQWKKVRLLGSAALSLAWVASGRMDAYVEEDIRIWDVAAGLSLVKAAGGEVFLKVNNRPNFVTAVATNGKISCEELV